MESQQEESAAAALDMIKVLEITSEGHKGTKESSDDRSEVASGKQTTDWLTDLDEVEEILHYKFKNKKLLEEALTHASFSDQCFSYERLEYVGDSVLNLLFTKEQYFLYQDLPPGALTRLRSANVDTEKLARVAIKHKLHRYLRHKMPFLEEQIREFSQAILDYPLHSNGLVDAPKALADIVEAAIGAVFIDSNFSIDVVWKVSIVLHFYQTYFSFPESDLNFNCELRDHIITNFVYKCYLEQLFKLQVLTRIVARNSHELLLN